MCEIEGTQTKGESGSTQIQAYMSIANSVINVEKLWFLDNKNLLHNIKHSSARARSLAWTQLCPTSMNIPNIQYVLGIIIQFRSNCVVISHQLPTQEILKISYPKFVRLYHLQMMDKTSIELTQPMSFYFDIINTNVTFKISMIGTQHFNLYKNLHCLRIVQ